MNSFLHESATRLKVELAACGLGANAPTDAIQAKAGGWFTELGENQQASVVQTMRNLIPTVAEVRESRERLQAALTATEAAQAVCDGHAHIDPAQIAFREGRAAGYMKTNPEYHWKQFVAQFGEVAGGREQFDAGIASV